MTFSKLFFHSRKTIYSYPGIHKLCVIISVDAFKGNTLKIKALL